MHEWWSDRDDEIYWLEVTDRNDIGANLNAPQTNERGDEFWSYSLLKFVEDGDIIFHYDRNEQAIVGYSFATGDIWEDTVVWAARGQSARSAGIQPHTRPGWYLGLEKYSDLESPLALDKVRDVQTELVANRDQLLELVGGPLYFPFELGSNRPLRPMQGYLFKLPAFFVMQFAQLEHFDSRLRIRERSGILGSDYRPTDEESSAGERDPFEVDPALIERSLRGHAVTQNALAAYIQESGLEPRSPAPDEPNFDLAWIHDSVIWVAEIKSLSVANEERQLRLGLGQLLHYRQLLRRRGIVHAVLVVERRPSDRSWEELCEELGVLLTWPGAWEQRLRL